MSFHRSQALFDRAQWRKRFLFPTWFCQLLMLLGLMGIFSYRLAETIEHYKENDENGKLPIVEVVWECTNIGFSLLSLILTIIEISRLLSESLTPFFLFASHIVKMTCSCAILGLDIVVYIKRTDGHWSLIGLAIDCGLLASMLVLTIYSVIVFRRVREDDGLQYPHNVKSFGYGEGYAEITQKRNGNINNGLVHPIYRANPYSSYNDQLVEVPLQGGRPRSVSAASSLSLYRSVSPSLRSLTDPHPSGSEPVDDGRRVSYSHERDTQFDAYRRRASSTSINKEDIDRAIGAELWGATGHAVLDRPSSVVGSGMVTRAVQPRPEHVNRATSWTVEPSVVANIPECIPEEGTATLREEEIAAALAAAKIRENQAASRDEQQGLLQSHGRNLSLEEPVEAYHDNERGESSYQGIAR